MHCDTFNKNSLGSSMLTSSSLLQQIQRMSLDTHQYIRVVEHMLIRKSVFLGENIGSPHYLIVSHNMCLLL